MVQDIMKKHTYRQEEKTVRRLLASSKRCRTRTPQRIDLVSRVSASAACADCCRAIVASWVMSLCMACRTACTCSHSRRADSASILLGICACGEFSKD